MINQIIRFSLENRLVALLFAVGLVFWGLMVAPFDWDLKSLPRDPVAVDAIPDIGENQQILFTEWLGRSPQDIEDQITYPLTTALLGMPQVKTIRSFSMFGFSTIYVIFKEEAEFYWSRSRMLEKLSSLPSDILPPGVSPQLGPDATALGQVFWYTLEGFNATGELTGGWDLAELRSAQDWQVRYALQGVDGVAEVASIGGFVKEYQIDIDPDALRAYGVSLAEVLNAVRGSNLDVGARTIEVNSVEYVIRGLGFVKSVEDLGSAVVAARDHVPVTLGQVASITYGPALRRGALDKGGTEAVGGVVVTRYGENPLAVIERVKERIEQLAPGMPRKVLADGTESQLQIVPFYDRTGLIKETLGTLEEAVRQQILVTIIVVLVLLMHLRSATLVSAVLPLAVLFAFVGMKLFKVDANVVALSGIAIAIGSIVDMGIVLVENILKHLQAAKPEKSRLEVVYAACSEVGGAVVTAALTTIVGFLPVLTMVAAEGKLFRPLAYTKTLALIGSIVVALVLIPALALWFLRARKSEGKRPLGRMFCYLLAVIAAWILSLDWAPFGPDRGVVNFIFVVLVLGSLMGAFRIFIHFYGAMLAFLLRFKLLFLGASLSLMLGGAAVWMQMGKEFMPDLDEGSFLFMPTTMPHASIGEVMDVLQKQDIAIEAIPEVESAVGKLGRVESPLDPAPISMIETMIRYKPEYGTNAEGKKVRQWRDHIRSSDDIWDAILEAAQIPGTTSAPRLQPIAARLVMLQSGMRAPMGLKVFGPDLEIVEEAALDLEQALKHVPGIRAESVFADRLIGKPYLEIDIDREAIARYGLTVRAVQEVIEVALGGRAITRTVEGRARYPVRVRYQRERRDSLEAIGGILVATPEGTQIPLRELAMLRYQRGPQVIKSEDTFLVGYVIFDKNEGEAEVDVVESAQAHLNAAIADGSLRIPEGVRFEFAGSYENQVRAEQKLRVVLPVALAIICLLLYFQFRRVWETLLVFSGILFAWGGGFLLLGLYAQPWFMDFELFGQNLRHLFQIDTINLSVAVWVGFLALFGIASDNGVIVCTYLQQSFERKQPKNIAAIRAATLQAGMRRVRPAVMTSATTLLALLPVLSSTGRGADIMIPMAIPVFGGMLLALLSVFVVPILYCAWAELRYRFQLTGSA